MSPLARREARWGLLFLSPFPQTENRMSAERAHIRNEFVAALADKVLIAYAHPGGSIERLCHKLSSEQKPLFALDDKYNSHLQAITPEIASPDTIVAAMLDAVVWHTAFPIA